MPHGRAGAYHAGMRSDGAPDSSTLEELWQALFAAVPGHTAGRSLTAALGCSPWLSEDAGVLQAWQALTAPENLAALVAAKAQPLPPERRRLLDEALKQCRRRQSPS